MRIELAFDAVCGENVSCRAVFPCRNDDRNVLFACCKHPAVLRVDLVVLLKHSAAQKPVHHLIRKEPFTFCLHILPYFEKMVLETAECLLLGNTCVGDTVHVVVEELFFLGRSEIPIAWNPVIVGVCHQVHDIFLKVVCRA